MDDKPGKIIRLDAVSSSNHEAFRLNALKPLDEFTVIITSHQYSGRGQGQTSWESEAGKNLTFSLILRPVFLPPARQFLLNQIIALGIRESISRLIHDERFTIKWPNDICYGKGKVSGTLIENQILGDCFELSVVGIGINMNQEVFVSDAPNPLSLKNINGGEFDLDLALEACLRAIFKWYEKLKDSRFDEIRQAYIEHLLGYGKKIKFASAEETFTSTIAGIDDFGRLVLEGENGIIQAFDMKEITFLL